jgi:hypothetical protein
MKSKEAERRLSEIEKEREQLLCESMQINQALSLARMTGSDNVDPSSFSVHTRELTQDQMRGFFYG